MRNYFNIEFNQIRTLLKEIAANNIPKELAKTS